MARDNVALFIEWARSVGVDQSIMFEADDLVAVRLIILFTLFSRDTFQHQHTHSYSR